MTRSRTTGRYVARRSCGVVVEQLASAAEDLVDAQLAVARADQGRLDGVGLAGATRPTLLAQHDLARGPRPRRADVSWRRSGARPAARRSSASSVELAQRGDAGEEVADLGADRLLDVVGPVLEAQAGSVGRRRGAG